MARSNKIEAFGRTKLSEKDASSCGSMPRQFAIDKPTDAIATQKRRHPPMGRHQVGLEDLLRQI
jgi:hypothetical protein